jgi:hypothetical protein
MAYCARRGCTYGSKNVEYLPWVPRRAAPTTVVVWMAIREDDSSTKATAQNITKTAGESGGNGVFAGDDASKAPRPGALCNEVGLYTMCRKHSHVDFFLAVPVVGTVHDSHPVDYVDFSSNRMEHWP